MNEEAESALAATGEVGAGGDLRAEPAFALAERALGLPALAVPSPREAVVHPAAPVAARRARAGSPRKGRKDGHIPRCVRAQTWVASLSKPASARISPQGRRLCASSTSGSKLG